MTYSEEICFKGVYRAQRKVCVGVPRRARGRTALVNLHNGLQAGKYHGISIKLSVWGFVRIERVCSKAGWIDGGDALPLIWGTVMPYSMSAI